MNEEEVTPIINPDYKGLNKQFYDSVVRLRKGGKVDFIIPVHGQKVVFAVRTGRAASRQTTQGSSMSKGPQRFRKENPDA